MSLRERLAQLGASEQRPSTEGKDHDPLLASLVSGEWVEQDGLRCLISEQSYGPDTVHGHAALGELLTLDTAAWHLASQSDSLPFDPARALFIDTETTGLMRGPGTVAFLVGVGLFRGDQFVVRQYFMPDYADEPALLKLITRDIDTTRGMVSFNGRSFDLPLLRTRYLLAGQELPALGGEHLDLLLIARRLWARLLPSCSLSSLERDALGVVRESIDVPGYLIPQLYYDYLRDGIVEPIANVFYHNHIDILSMVTLATQIGRLLEDPVAIDSDPLRDYYALGRICERYHLDDQATLAYRLAGHLGSPMSRPLARQRLSMLLKRQELYEEAMEIWRQELAGEGIWAHVELAKQYEHRLKDIDQARAIVLNAMQKIEAKIGRNNPKDRQTWAALQHRLKRLDCKFSKRNEKNQRFKNESADEA